MSMCQILRNGAPDPIGCDPGVVAIIPLIRRPIHHKARLRVVTCPRARKKGNRSPLEVQRGEEQRESLKRLSYYYELEKNRRSIRANELLSRGEHGSTAQHTRNVPLT